MAHNSPHKETFTNAIVSLKFIKNTAEFRQAAELLLNIIESMSQEVEEIRKDYEHPTIKAVNFIITIYNYYQKVTDSQPEQWRKDFQKKIVPIVETLQSTSKLILTSLNSRKIAHYRDKLGQAVPRSVVPSTFELHSGTNIEDLKRKRGEEQVYGQIDYMSNATGVREINVDVKFQSSKRCRIKLYDGAQITRVGGSITIE